MSCTSDGSPVYVGSAYVDLDYLAVLYDGAEKCTSSGEVDLVVGDDSVCL